MERGRILIADDDEAVLRTFGTTLRQAGFAVEEVDSGRAAVEALSRRSFDAMVADIQMPGNRSLELARLRRHEQPMLPIILVTGQPCFDSAVRALRNQVVEYLTKPVHPKTLLESVDAAVRRGRTLRSLHVTKQRAQVLAEAVQYLESAVTSAGDGFAPPEAVERAETDPLDRLPMDLRDLLSTREREVTSLVAVGMQVKEVATALGVSRNTVRNHLRNIFIKLKLRSQAELLVRLAGRIPGEGRSRAVHVPGE